MNYAPQMNRRSFVIGAVAGGGGLALGLELPFGPRGASATVGGPEINAWVVIQPDETVVIRIAKSEMGQGTITGLAQLVAEELECEWSKVTIEYPTPGQNLARKQAWGSMFTAGSRGIRESQELVRKGGAAARQMLIQAAANGWNVPSSECSAAGSVITHKTSGRMTTFGKVADAAGKLEAPKEVQLKDPKDWKIAGKPVKRLDTLEKLTGKLVYGIDITLPSMLNAAIRDCPVFGGKVKSFDAEKVMGMKGVKKVVRVGESGAAVVADTWWQAKTALDVLPIVWDEGENAKVSSASIAEWLKAGLDAEQAFVGNQNGDAKAALANAAKKVEEVYSYPYQNHATMEPMNATALYTADKCEVWCPTQNGDAALAAVIEASGLPAPKCEVHKVTLGGGFGRRGFTDFIRQAVAIAKEMPGTPVKLLWSREEDMTHGRYHPVTQAKMVGGFDANGNLTVFHMRISGQSILASVRPENLQSGRDPVTFQGLNPSGPESGIGYTIPNLLIDHSMRNPHVPPGFWRGVNINHNSIYLECFIDELAHSVGEDPLEFRRKLMREHPKHLAVLNAVAEKIEWEKPRAQGVHRGIAQMMSFGSYVAGATEISVVGDSKIKIHRIVAATDPGYAVNPAQIERQIAGSFVYGLSALFYQECTVKDGRIEQENFDTYNSMRIAEMPKVETIVMPSGGFWGGIGEPTICVAGPAVQRLPDDVREEYGRRYGQRFEAKFFATANAGAADAKRLFREWENEVDFRIEAIRAERTGEGVALTPLQGRALAGEWYEWFIARHPISDKNKWEALREQVHEALRETAGEEVWERSDPDALWREDAELRKGLRPILADVGETAQFLATKRLGLNNEARDRFLDWLYEDLADALRRLLRIADGDYSADKYAERFPKFEGLDGGETPHQLFEAWVLERKPARSSVESWRYVFAEMASHFKDRSAGSIRPDEAQGWIRSLAGKRSPSTIRKNWITASRTIFGWALEHKRISRNPFADVKITVPKRHRFRETQAFLPDEWGIILRASLAITELGTPDNAARRWVPWLCAYTGARPGEMTQLRGADVIERGGIPGLRITPEAGTVKNNRSRVVPIHGHLIEQGFLEFVKKLGAGPMFYRVAKEDGVGNPLNVKKPRYTQARQRLADWVRNLGVSDPELLPNHAWRHTFKQIADRAGISERMSDHITGHAHKSAGAGYGAPILSDMAQALVRFPRYEV